MKKLESIDLAKFNEAQDTIHTMQNQFCDMVLDELKVNPVLQCRELYKPLKTARWEHYRCSITVSEIDANLYFDVSPLSDSDENFVWGVRLICETLSISCQYIHPEFVTLSFTNTDKTLLLQKPGN